MHAMLLVQQRGREFAVELPGEGAILGRETSLLALRPICASDYKMSSRHCRLTHSQAGWRVEDLRSTNGTFVNGQRIEQRELQHLEVIRIGELSLRFFDPQQHDSASPRVALSDWGASAAVAEKGTVQPKAAPVDAMGSEIDPDAVQIREELARTRVGILALEGECQILRHKREQVAAQGNELKGQLRALLEERERDRNTLEAQRSTGERLRAALQQAVVERDALRTQIELFETSRREATAIAQRVPSLIERSERAEAELQRVLKSCSDAQREAQELREVLGGSERVLGGLRETVRLHACQIDTLRNELDLRDKALAQEQECRDELRRRFAALQRELEGRNGELRELRAENCRLSVLCKL